MQIHFLPMQTSTVIPVLPANLKAFIDYFEPDQS